MISQKFQSYLSPIQTKEKKDTGWVKVDFNPTLVQFKQCLEKRKTEV